MVGNKTIYLRLQKFWKIWWSFKFELNDSKNVPMKDKMKMLDILDDIAILRNKYGDRSGVYK